MAVIGFTKTVDVDSDRTIYLVPTFYALMFVQHELNEIVTSDESADVAPRSPAGIVFPARGRPNSLYRDG